MPVSSNSLLYQDDFLFLFISVFFASNQIVMGAYKNLLVIVTVPGGRAAGNGGNAVGHPAAIWQHQRGQGRGEFTGVVLL